MKKEYFFKFDKVFTVIAFIYIVIMPLFFMERNEIVFLCFSAFFFVEKLALLHFLKDDASKNKKLLYLLIAIILIGGLIYGMIRLFGFI